VRTDPRLASEEPNWSQYSKKSTTPVDTFIIIPDFTTQHYDMNYIDGITSEPSGLDTVVDNEKVGVKFENAQEKMETQPTDDPESEAAVRKSAKKKGKKAKPNRIMRTVCKRSGLIGPAHLLHPNKSRRFVNCLNVFE
jgi:hypothetical protein